MPKRSDAANPIPDALTPPRADPYDAAERWEEAPPDGEPEYRRRRRPVPVNRRRRLNWVGIGRRGWKPLLLAAVVIALAAGADDLVFHGAWFVLAGSDQIAVRGAEHANPARIAQVFSVDFGRNIFFIPLADRRREIEALPWVRSATVLRLWPARLQIQIQERVPIAFTRVGTHLALLDAAGFELPLPANGKYDFPVLTGLAGVDAARPNAPRWLAVRQNALERFTALKAALDGGGHDRTRNFSEIDLSDPADLTARVSIPGQPGIATLVHFGNTNFAARYRLFLAQIAGWLQRYPGLTSVDLRYDGEAIVDPGSTASGQAGADPAAGHKTLVHAGQKK